MADADAPTKHLPDPSPRNRRLPGSPLTKDISLDLKTITPILGGASETRTVDTENPVRVPSIRGALRFWWRALHGYRYATPSELAQKEAELWGRAGDERGGRSRVDISLKLVQSPEVDPLNIDMRAKDAYALWPARGNERNNIAPAPRLKPGLVFSLHLRAPQDAQEDLIQTLRAWILFGGYGSRTRRGCGSFCVLSDARFWLPTSISRDEIKRLFGDIPLFAPVNPSKAGDMPLLHGASLFHKDPIKNSLEAWHTALGWLRDFRQGRNIAREPGSENRPGRSYWPEPDKIRYLVGQRPHAHPPRREYGSTPVWPRASFGLPIVGQFQQKSRHGGYYAQGDPRSYEPDAFELVWKDNKGNVFERLASPLILKPMALANGPFVPIALWLFRAFPPYAEVVLRQHKHVIAKSHAPFDALTARNETSAFPPLIGKHSMRKAFCDWLKTVQHLKELT